MQVSKDVGGAHGPWGIGFDRELSRTALMAEFNHGLGLRRFVERYLPEPGSNRGYAPSVFVDCAVLMLQAGGRVRDTLQERGF